LFWVLDNVTVTKQICGVWKMTDVSSVRHRHVILGVSVVVAAKSTELTQINSGDIDDGGPTIAIVFHAKSTSSDVVDILTTVVQSEVVSTVRNLYLDSVEESTDRYSNT
jgi:hypothetical protein